MKKAIGPKMQQAISPRKVWDEYQKGRSFNDNIELYDDVEQNENFVRGKQWEGVNAPDLPKPVINFLHRAVSWCVAVIVSDDIAVSLSSLRKNDDIALMTGAVGAEVDRVIELTTLKTKNRKSTRDASVRGDSAVYFWFDPSVENGQAVKGEIKAELIDGINVHFGNPYITEVQEQPYIILAQRRMTHEVREEARGNGIPENEVQQIVSDEDENSTEQTSDFELCTTLIKLWKQNGTIWAVKGTRNAKVRKPYDTGLKRYPIAWNMWEEVKDQYHGRAIVTGMIPNQIAANKLMAMMIHSVEMNAFPKIVYDGVRISNWNNKVGQAIKATGAVTNDLVMNVRGGDVSTQVMEFINQIIAWSKDAIGASDAATGNVQPDNAQAIIAVQQSSIVPLQMQKLNNNDFVEQEVRIIVDMMRAYYGAREVMAESYRDAKGNKIIGEDGESITTITYDFAKLDDPNIRLNVDVGQAAFWSELMQVQTMDNLFAQGVIPDVLLYVESIPDHYMRNKQDIIDAIKQAQNRQQQQQPQLSSGAQQAFSQADALALPEPTQQTPGGVIQ